MQPSSPRLSLLFRSGLVLLTLGFFAACDRHPAGEPGEGYGHGSSHQKSYANHSIDSTEGKDHQASVHFSDTRGVQAEKAEGAETKTAAPAETSEKRFNP